MSNRSEAEEHLRVIRSLMEKATIYRTISAEAAAIGGSVAIVILFLTLGPLQIKNSLPFLGVWIGALIFTGIANLWLLYRAALRRREAFVSPGMKLALKAMLPGLLAGGACILVESDGGDPLTASLWVLCYGVSLLASCHFAPKSIYWLGRAFFLTGLLLIASGALLFDWWRGTNQPAIAHGIMAATFGLFHLIYAACTWPRKKAATSESAGEG